MLIGHAARDHEQGRRQDQTQGSLGDVYGEIAADEDARQRADQQRDDDLPIDRAHHPVAETGDQRQRHCMRNVGTDDLGHRKMRIVEPTRSSPLSTARAAISKDQSSLRSSATMRPSHAKITATIH